jgi:hypothetical protein
MEGFRMNAQLGLLFAGADEEDVSTLGIESFFFFVL